MILTALRRDVLHRTASERRLGGDLSAELLDDKLDEPANQSWPPKVRALTLLQEAFRNSASHKSCLSRFGKTGRSLDTGFVLLHGVDEVKLVGSRELTVDSPLDVFKSGDSVKPSIECDEDDKDTPSSQGAGDEDTDDFYCGNVDDIYCGNVDSFTSIADAELVEDASQEKQRIVGSIHLSGSLCEYSVPICNALRLALQQVVSAALGEDDVGTIAVSCNIHAISKFGKINLASNAGLKFPFEINFPESDDDFDAVRALIAFNSEAIYAGAQYLLPALVESLPLAARLKVRLEADLVPVAAVKRHSLGGLLA